MELANTSTQGIQAIDLAYVQGAHTCSPSHTHILVLLRISCSDEDGCQFTMTKCKVTHGSHMECCFYVRCSKQISQLIGNAFVFNFATNKTYGHIPT